MLWFSVQGHSVCLQYLWLHTIGRIYPSISVKWHPQRIQGGVFMWFYPRVLYPYESSWSDAILDCASFFKKKYLTAYRTSYCSVSNCPLWTKMACLGREIFWVWVSFCMSRFSSPIYTVPCLVPKIFPTVSVISNLRTHVWNIKCSWKKQLII